MSLSLRTEAEENRRKSRAGKGNEIAVNLECADFGRGCDRWRRFRYLFDHGTDAVAEHAASSSPSIAVAVVLRYIQCHALRGVRSSFRVRSGPENLPFRYTLLLVYAARLCFSYNVGVACV